MYKLFLLLVFSAGCFRLKAQSLILQSPDKQASIQLNTDSSPLLLISLKLLRGNLTVINGGVGVRADLNPAIKYSSHRKRSVSTTWKPLYGERAMVTDKFNELTILHANSSSGEDSIRIICRLYNEAFAYRYEIIRPGRISLHGETSYFITPKSTIAWKSKFAQSAITQLRVDQITDTVERPLTCKSNDQNWFALGEAALTDYARMKFAGNKSDTLFCVLDGPVQSLDSMKSPWRYVLIGNSPTSLLAKNYLVENLNEPLALQNPTWIKPGKILREVTLSTAGAYNCIDFAAKHNLSYICFDAGWYGKEDSDTSDATRVSLDPARARGQLTLDSVIAYGKQKGIGVFLYVNRRALERQLDTLLPLYKSWGIKGIKFGFVQVGSQKVTAWLHHAIGEAAKHQLLVDVHDEYRPTGVSRTYPNLLTQEGIRGDEESPSTVHTIKTIFTRMIAGAADNTNCYFTERVDKMGSHVAQMAKAVCIYSPLQFVYWYDRPAKDSLATQRKGEITEVADLDWYDNLPVSWDETRIIEGNMESHVVIARRLHSNWWLGALNGDSDRNLVITPAFLDKHKKYKAVIYIDNPLLQTFTRVERKLEQVNSKSKMSFRIQPGCGLAIRFEEIHQDLIMD